MTDQIHELWKQGVLGTIHGYRRMIDATLGQLTDDELHRRPHPEFNSVAINLRHISGNLQSRWTDFLTTDGEKPSRDRETEFDDWTGDRTSLLAYFDTGWSCLTSAVESLTAENIGAEIYIRGEAHSVPDAVARSITHLSYHVGQIVLVARLVHEGHWKWLTIAPGDSEAHNQRTWGTASARSTFADSSAPRTE